MKELDRNEARKRIEFELAAFGPGSIFNTKKPEIRERIEELKAKLMELDGQETERRSA